MDISVNVLTLYKFYLKTQTKLTTQYKWDELPAMNTLFLLHFGMTYFSI